MAQGIGGGSPGASSAGLQAEKGTSHPSARGVFYLIAGPAGVGKTTLLKRLLSEEKKLARAISVTTRQPRVGETDGVAYHFWDEKRFKEALARGEFLEAAQVHGHFYGTLGAFVEEKLSAGIDVIKDIDVQGAGLLRKLERYKYPQTVGIFVLPPSRAELAKRLEGRATEDRKSLAERLAVADAEIARINEFEYAIMNDVFERAYAQLKAIRLAEHCRVERLRWAGSLQHFSK